METFHISVVHKTKSNLYKGEFGYVIGRYHELP